MKKRSPLPISIERLTEEFQKPELRDSYPNFYDLKTPIDRILWVLWVLKEQFRIMEYAPADVISDILIDGMGHRLSPLSVTKALARTSQDKYNSKLLNDETVYKIMQLGIDYLQSLNRDDTLLVHFMRTPLLKAVTDLGTDQHRKIHQSFLGLRPASARATVQPQ